MAVALFDLLHCCIIAVIFKLLVDFADDEAYDSRYPIVRPLSSEQNRSEYKMAAQHACIAPFVMGSSHAFQTSIDDLIRFSWSSAEAKVVLEI